MYIPSAAGPVEGEGTMELGAGLPPLKPLTYNVESEPTPQHQSLVAGALSVVYASTVYTNGHVCYAAGSVLVRYVLHAMCMCMRMRALPRAHIHAINPPFSLRTCNRCR